MSDDGQEFVVTDEMREKYRETFKQFDKNGDDKMDSKELYDMVCCCNCDPTKQEVEDMMQKADIDSDGFISLDEFIKVMEGSGLEKGEDTRKEEYRGAFEVFDKDKSGYIDRNELLKVLFSMDETASQEELNETAKEMLDTADTNGDGKIDIEEFISMVTAGY